MSFPYYLTRSAAGTPGRRKDKWDAAASPSVTDDSDSGYDVGSRWLDTVASKLWVAKSVGVGTAVWLDLGAGGDLTSLLIDLSVSGAHTVDRADAATHDLTLTGNTTLTPAHTSPVAGEAIDLRVLVRQDGTGGWTLAWGGTIDWAGGSAPTMPTDPGALLTVGLLSVDDGVTWLGYVVEDAPAPSTTVESETTFGITPAVGADTEYARQDHTHGSPANPVTVAAISALGFVGEILISDTPSAPLVFADLIQNEAQDDLVYSD